MKGKSKTMSEGVIVGAVVVVLLFVGYMYVTDSFPETPAQIAQPFQVGPPVQTPTTGGSCISQVPNTANVGEAATVTLTAYDQESNTPTSTVLPADARAYVNGQLVQDDPGMGGTSFATVTVGEQVTITGGNSSAYLDPYTFCVTREAQSEHMKSYAAATSANMEIIGYDSATNVLDARTTNDSFGDYNLTLGGDDEKQIKLKVSVQAANVARRIGGMAFYTGGDVESVNYQGIEKFVGVPADVQAGFDTGVSYPDVPKFLKDSDISNDIDSYTNISGYEDYVKFNKPIHLSEWDEAWFVFSIETDADNPDQNSVGAGNDFNTRDQAIICFLDAVYERGSDGRDYEDTYQHDSAEGNVGVTEDIVNPAGQDSCVIITAI